jgi:hypothetical protein
VSAYTHLPKGLLGPLDLNLDPHDLVVGNLHSRLEGMWVGEASFGVAQRKPDLYCSVAFAARLGDLGPGRRRRRGWSSLPDGVVRRAEPDDLDGAGIAVA